MQKPLHEMSMLELAQETLRETRAIHAILAKQADTQEYPPPASQTPEWVIPRSTG